MKVRDVLAAKGSQVHTVGPDQTVQEAVALLMRHRIGALLVVDGSGQPVGILSERDVLRECHRGEGRLGALLVREAMTRDLVVGAPDDELTHAMATMTERRVRHLPILAQGRVAGLVSIGDVVKACLEETAHENRFLRDYIQAR
jgi:CBS domain-containing protein